jgi:hypothetical protein
MAGAEGTLTVSASSTEGRIGDTVEITLTVDSNPGFAALLINVKTGDGFELVSAKNGTVMHNMTTGNNILWDSASDSTSTGTLLTLSIKICENARLGDNYIEVKVLECYNSSLNSVNVAIDSMQIKVVGDQQTTETESTVESSVETNETESTVESSAETNETESIIESSAESLETEPISPGESDSDNDTITISHDIHAIDDAAAEPTDLNNGTDTITIQDINFDAAGHVVANKSHEYTLPYGFKHIRTSSPSYGITSIGEISATKTQDTLNINSNHWIDVSSQ